MTPERRAISWMLVLTALWVLVEVLAGFLHQSYSPFQVVWTRYAVHLLFMLAVWGPREPRTLWKTRRPAFQLARSLLMLAMPAAVIVAMARGIEGDTIWTVFWVAPFLILTFAAICLGERAPAGVWLACATALAGTSLLFGPGLPRSAWSIVLPLLSAASFSLYVVMTRMLRWESTRSNLFYTALGVFAGLTPIIPRLWITPTGHDLAVLSAIGLLGLGGLYALDRMASVSAVSWSAPVSALQVAFTIGARDVLTRHVPGIRTWVGVCLVGAAALWTWARRNPIAVSSGV
jgi:drug/metabolite transporter (DMT)-like permease